MSHFQELDLPFKEQNYCEELHCLWAIIYDRKYGV